MIPFDRIYECRNILSPHFKDKAIYRLTEPEAERYKQAVLFGVRRSPTEKNRLNDQAVNQANWKLQELTRRYEEIPALPNEADRAYAYRKARRSEWNTEGSHWTWLKICWGSHQRGCRPKE